MKRKPPQFQVQTKTKTTLRSAESISSVLKNNLTPLGIDALIGIGTFSVVILSRAILVRYRRIVKYT